MISLKDLLPSDVQFEQLPDNVQSNLRRLHGLLTSLERAYKADGGTNFTITSGLRSMQKHLGIYKDINAKRAKAGQPPLKVPMGSQHLSGNAADIWDRAGKLKAWAVKNVKVLEELGLWCEAPEATPTWLHVQTVPPKSGNRFFKP